MANRFSTRQRSMVVNFLIARDGNHCLICGRKPSQVKLQIDHADNNPVNWEPNNLHLLCQRDNLELRYKTIAEHKRLIEHYAANNANERACKRGPKSTHMVRELIDYRSGNTEMKANSYFETQFVEWVLSEITRNGILTKDELLNAGAAFVGCSQITAARYLAKLTSFVGPLEETKDTIGADAICFKRDFQTKLKIKQENPVKKELKIEPKKEVEKSQ